MKAAMYCLIFFASIVCNASEAIEFAEKEHEVFGGQMYLSYFERSKLPEPDNDPCSPYPLCLWEN